ncbi:MAG TPA: LPS export ABC transporter ATP-binding protein [Candidatus Acetothermia bacterium]|nr:LPS export ABC transporter ATP-binding protein [Candidatus Acetothermia bacterium]
MTLEARELTKTYRNRSVVCRLSLSVDRGQIVGLLGPNGAGKTTMFYMMIGFISSEGGRVLLDGKDISRFPFFRRARLGIGYLPQEPSVFTQATVSQNMDLAMEWTPKRRVDATQRDELLAEFGLLSLSGQLAGSLSSGERRRLEIARTLATRPHHVLLDEPFSGIDPISIADLQQQILSLRARSIGVVITDHNVRDTLSITDSAILIDRGRPVAQGSPQEILSDPEARRVYLGEGFRP